MSSDEAGSPAGGAPAPDAAGAGGAPPRPAAGAADSPSSWIEQIADDKLRSRVGKFAGKPVTALAEAYANAESLIGSDPASLVKIDDEVLKDPTGVLKRLGAADNPADYKLALDGLPEEFTKADDLAWYQKVAADLKLLPAQADKLFQAAVQLARSQQTAAAESLKERADKDVSTLRERHGKEFDGLVADAKRAAKDLGLTEVLGEAGLGTHPAVIEALAKVGRLIGGETPPGSLAQGDGRVGPREAGELARDAKRKELEAVRAGDRAAAQRYAAEARRYYARAGG